MSLDAVERQGMPFVGETGGVGPGQGMGEVPVLPATTRPPARAAPMRQPPARARDRAIPLDPEMQRRLDEARRDAGRGTRTPTRGAGPAATRRAPRPERLQR